MMKIDNEKKDNEISIRPKSLNEYIGENKVKENISIFVSASKKRNETLDHTLLYGPPGLGKTTLAYIIAHEMGANIISINGPSISKAGDIASILSSIEVGDILFIDEIHRISKSAEEILYIAMEDFKLITSSVSSSIEISLPPFTLIGATTKPGLLSSPFRARFGINLKFNYYKEEELDQIIDRYSLLLNTRVDKRAIREISKRSRGTPRDALRLFKRIRDYANFYNFKDINYELTMKAFDQFNINSIGLNEIDIKYLSIIFYKFNGGPVGLTTLATSLNEEVLTLLDVIEPFLLEKNLIKISNKGRELTQSAHNYLKNC